MRSISVQKSVDPSPEAIWAVLADFPNIHTWNSGVSHSFATGAESGVGAQRHCDLKPAGTLEETVREWEPISRMVVSIDSTTKVPIAHGEATFELAPRGGGTQFILTYRYEVKPAFLSPVLGPLLDRRLKSGFAGVIDDAAAAAAI